MSKGGKKSRQRSVAPSNSPTQVAISKVESSFQGPLPPPQILQHYDEIVPGSAERIISLWESQVQHRQGLEKKTIESDIRQSYFGSTLGFIIAMFTIGVGSFLTYIGRSTEGLATIITALVGLVSVYGWGSYQRRKERNIRLQD